MINEKSYKTYVQLPINLSLHLSNIMIREYSRVIVQPPIIDNIFPFLLRTLLTLITDGPQPLTEVINALVKLWSCLLIFTQVISHFIELLQYRINPSAWTKISVNCDYSWCEWKANSGRSTCQPFSFPGLLLTVKVLYFWKFTLK